MIEPFEYTDDPRTWIPYHRCPADLSAFNEQLKSRFGLNCFGEANFKAVWGGSEQEHKSDGRYGLKYFRVFTKPRLKANEHSGLLVMTNEREELGVPRVIIERFTPPDRLAPSEALKHPRGFYSRYYEVEDNRGKYRPPGYDTLEHIAKYVAGEEEEQKRQDLELKRMLEEEERDLERNAAGENLPYNPGQPSIHA